MARRGRRELRRRSRMPAKGYQKPFRGDVEDGDALIHWARRFVEHLRVRNYAERTLVTTNGYLRLFCEWAEDRSLTRPAQITKPIVEAYQRWLFYFRRPSGKPLSFLAQRTRLHKLRVFFKWLAKTNVIPSNPAADLEMPRIEKRLPRVVFTESEVLKVLEQPDTTDVLGLRDRAMMEVLYSTGIRRFELANLELYDVDAARGTLTVRQGKNRKDRVVPIGERALAWVRRYLDEARSLLVATPEHPTLFLDERGDKLNLMQLTPLMRGYIDAAKLGKSGACHVFRHTMATLMLEGGADVRHIQEILGHSQLSTTAIYTRVSIRHLKAVHDATHPAAKLASAGGGSEATTAESARAAPLELARGGAAESHLFSSLAAEAAEELDDG
jgi:integrase/recombinase XerD